MNIKKSKAIFFIIILIFIIVGLGKNIFAAALPNIYPPYNNNSNYYPSSYPLVITQNALTVLKTGATLVASINPNNSYTIGWFEYSTSPNFYPTIRTDDTSAGATNYYSTISQSLNNLLSNTTYYFRAVARNNSGTARGNIYSFTTQKQDTLTTTTPTTTNLPTVEPQTTTKQPEAVKPATTKKPTPSLNIPKINISKNTLLVFLGIIVFIILIGYLFAKNRGRH